MQDLQVLLYVWVDAHLLEKSMPDLVVLDHAHHAHFMDAIDEYFSLQVRVLVELCNQVVPIRLQLIHQFLCRNFLSLLHHFAFAKLARLFTIGGHAFSFAEVGLICTCGCGDGFDLRCLCIVTLIQVN